MITSWLHIIAMAPPADGKTGGLGQMLPMMLIVFAIFYFMLIRPQQRKEKERKKMISEIKSGTRVMFSGGILGTVTNIKDSTFIIKVADGVKLEVSRSCVSQVIGKSEKEEEA